MSTETTDLLHLFSILLHNPPLIFALQMETISQKLKNRQGRNGAQGLVALLAEKEGLTNAEIAEKLDIKPSSVTAQVKLLESKAFIERVTDKNDRRVSRVFLTEKGRKIQIEYSEKKDKLSEGIFGQLSNEERQQLTVILEKLITINSNWRE